MFFRALPEESHMGLHYAHLTLAERRTIFRLLQERQSVGSIATLLGRHRSTIHREIARNFHHSPVRDRWDYPERGHLRPGFQVPGLPHAAGASVFLQPAEPLAEGRGGECQRPPASPPAARQRTGAALRRPVEPAGPPAEQHASKVPGLQNSGRGVCSTAGNALQKPLASPLACRTSA
ncbi:helix-turn-helix domain-containing protein [Indioceanicola profundi]|uniref:helix-turn-helix domain-containing protein n=1 Tax=Indioceanicola profundi TaxID=2220096 RepID=UPI000E6AA604